MRLRDGTEVQDPRLGRLVSFDEQSRAFPTRALIPDGAPERNYFWYLPSTAEVLDQGRNGSCVGFGVTNKLRYTPHPVRDLDATFAKEQIYWEAQRVDEWEGGSYPGADPFYEGTSVLAGVKVAVTLGYVLQYRWAFGEPDLALAIGYLGPAVIGVNWREGMFQPDGDNYIHATGPTAGGHCVLVIGISLRRDDYTIMQSWGPDWGDRGRARIKRADMIALLADQGEACVITKRPKGPTP